MHNRLIEIFYLFFQGVLIFQAIIFFVLYFVAARKELLYYSLFLFFAAIYFFINAPYTFFGIAEDIVWNSGWYEQLNDWILVVQNIFYLLFLKSFFIHLAPAQKVKRVFSFSLLSIPVLIILLSFFSYSTPGYQLLYYIVQLIPVIPALIVAVAIIKNRFPFAVLVANGLLANVAGILLTLLMNIFRNNNLHHLFIEGYPLFFVRMGILADMVFFLIAILKKWHYQEKQLLIEKLQAQLQAEKLRTRKIGRRSNKQPG